LLEIKTTTVGGLDFDCAEVQVTELQRNFSAADNVLGTLTMSAKRTFSAGAPVALFTVAAVS
jgi:ribosomal protein S6